MRKVIAAIAVVVVSMLGGAAASAPPPPYVEMTASLTASQTTDIGARGPTIGDASVRKWRLSDREGNAIGTGYEVCSWTGPQLRHCVGAYGLVGGSIAFNGVVGDGSPLAVVGGTGIYARASGQLTRRGKTVVIDL